MDSIRENCLTDIYGIVSAKKDLAHTFLKFPVRNRNATVVLSCTGLVSPFGENAILSGKC